MFKRENKFQLPYEVRDSILGRFHKLNAEGRLSSITKEIYYTWARCQTDSLANKMLWHLHKSMLEHDNKTECCCKCCFGEKKQLTFADLGVGECFTVGNGDFKYLKVDSVGNIRGAPNCYGITSKCLFSAEFSRTVTRISSREAFE